MCILLEEGMLIKNSDEAYYEDEWDLVGMVAGDKCRKDHFPMRREIQTIEDLFELTIHNKQ